MIDFKDYNVMADVKGTIQGTMLAGIGTLIDWQVPYNCYLTGVDYEAVKHNPGDKITFQVVHPVAGVIAQFASDIFARDFMEYSFYKANLYQGLIIRVIYTNVGPNDVKFNANLILHKDK
jgi:hypothetical protein